MCGSETEVRGACPEIGQAQLMEIADNLLNEVVRLREENKRLREIAKTLQAKPSKDEMWQAWQEDDSEDTTEWFDQFTHAAEEYERLRFWKLESLKYEHATDYRQAWRHQVQWGKDFLTPRDRWLHEPA